MTVRRQVGTEATGGSTSALSALALARLGTTTRPWVQVPSPLPLQIAIRDGGHHVATWVGTYENVMIDLSRMKGVRVDPGEMEQVLTNLAVNARAAMPNGGKLIIETSYLTLNESDARHHLGANTGDYVVLTVTDVGIGMTEELKSHVFEPFFTTKGVGEGTGLGLSTCYGIVSKSEGHITVESEPGKGTTFKVYLPRIDEPASQLPVREKSDELPLGTETVFLVEDEPMVRRMASQVLREQDYTVLESTNGVEALRFAEERVSEEFHLLLTDVVMPLMGGRDLAERLRTQHPETRVIFTSGYTDEAVGRLDPLRSGSDFIQKPFTPATLALKVREVLDR